MLSADQEALVVVGKSCNIIQDDNIACNIENGVHLILWNQSTEENIWIDRFDARTLFSTYVQFKKQGNFQIDHTENGEDLNTERYKDLADVNEEEDIWNEPTSSNIVQKWRYKYDDDVEKTNYQMCEPYIVPNLEYYPEGMIFPKTRKVYDIILHTAKNTRQSIQLEILLKVKQAQNKDFGFLNPDSELFQFYQVSLMSSILLDSVL